MKNANTTASSVESKLDGSRALAEYLAHHPYALCDMRQLMRRFQLSAESCMQALQLWEKHTLATAPPSS